MRYVLTMRETPLIGQAPAMLYDYFEAPDDEQAENIGRRMAADREARNDRSTLIGFVSVDRDER